MTKHPSSGRARPPLVAAETWQTVVRRAGFRCQCAGQCGKDHAHDRHRDRDRDRDGRTGGPAERCAREDVPGRPLHLITARPAYGVAAMTCDPDRLIAVCPGCHIRIDRARRREHVAAPSTTDAVGLF